MGWNRLAVVMTLVAGSTVALGQAAPEVVGKIETVTVYRGQALVTRVIDLPREAGEGSVREVVVTDLPPAIQSGSLHAEGGAPGVAIRSVVFRAKPIEGDVREEVRAIDAKIEEIASRQAGANRRLALMQEHAAYINSLQGFVAPSAQAELSKGVLNADTLTKLSEFIYRERERIATTQLSIEGELKQLAAEMDLAQRERAKVSAGTSRSVNQAVIAVSAEEKAPARVRLMYLVDQATWSPSYAVRAPGGGESRRDGLTLEYYASVSQMSGEDWGNVAMTLSTATPSLVAKAPTLTAMSIRLSDVNAPAAAKQAADAREYARARQEIEQQLRKIADDRNRSDVAASLTRAGGAQAGGKGENVMLAFDSSLNTIASDMQLLDLVADRRIRRVGERATPSIEEGIAVTYTIPGATTLASRSQQQLIQIMSATLPATYAKIATPVLTSYVYDEALVTNASSTVLLAGPVTAYSGGAFVGTGEIPTTAVGQAFSVGLGIDSSLRARRELIERTDAVQGGNRVVDVAYRLSIENFGAAPAAVRVLDRLPRSAEGQVLVTLVGSSVEPSKAAEDEKARKEGILRWDLSVPPRSTAQGASGIEYKFRLEHDKQMTIVGMKD